MENIIIHLVVTGLFGWLIVTYIPMIQPIKTIVIIGFAIIALAYLVQLIPYIRVLF